jgi:hypothetical protein
MDRWSAGGYGPTGAGVGSISHSGYWRTGGDADLFEIVKTGALDRHGLTEIAIG